MSFQDELEKLFEDMGFWKTGRKHIKWWLDEDGCRVDWTYEIDQALTSIINLVDKEKNTPTQIMGIPIDEVCGILTMLDMERLAEMNLTMANLHKWQELLANEQRKIFDESMRAILRGNR